MKYQPTSPVLKRLIKEFWVMRSDEPVQINHKLLPVGNADLILNLSDPIRYIFDERHEAIPEPFHFCGIRQQSCTIVQSGRLFVLGVSFFPAGLYPFIRIPVSELTDDPIDLNSFRHDVSAELADRIAVSDPMTQKLETVEEHLLRLLNPDLIPEESASRIMDGFFMDSDDATVGRFCRRIGITPRRLERIFDKYIGVSPKCYRRIRRFQSLINPIISRNFSSLTSLGYDYGFYDQTHFAKDFQSFAGCSPRQFIRQRDSVKEILKYG